LFVNKKDSIERFVIDDNVDGESSLTIELRPLSVSISSSESAAKDVVHTAIMSRQTNILDVVSAIRSSFKIPVSNKRPVRLMYTSKDAEKPVHHVEINASNTLNNSGYGPDDVRVL
jgi:hypothetical protein